VFLYWPDATEAAEHFSFQLVRMFSEAPQGAGDFTEIHRAARHIRSGSIEDWYSQFSALGETVKAIADEALAAGHDRTAAEALLRAFGYLRSAEWALPGSDPRKVPMYERAVACFRDGLTLARRPYEVVSIPWEEHELSGYFFPPDEGTAASNEKPPCIVFLSGADALPEENYFRGGRYITARGCACVLVNGPGQGRSLRIDGLTTIYDYERPMSAVVDYVESRGDVDASRMGMFGVSMAGYYALRAVAKEPRFTACVIWGALYDVLADLYETFPPIRAQLNWIVGAASEAEARERYSKFNLEGLLGDVRCPVLITHGAKDRMVPLASAQRTLDELGGEKKLRVYEEHEGGAEHCSIDNFVQAIPFQVDWLVDRLAARDREGALGVPA
jgi:dienelactone hydrolase